MDKYLYWFLTREPEIKLAYIAVVLVIVTISCLLSVWSIESVFSNNAIPSGTTIPIIDAGTSTKTQEIINTIVISTVPTAPEGDIMLTPEQEVVLTQTPSLIGLAIVTAQSVNLRSGPGTTYAIVGNVKKGEKLPVYGQNEDRSWLQLDVNGTKWIKSSLVELSQDITITPTETARTEGLLPGLQPSDVKVNLENLQFTCELVYTPSESDPYFKWECKRESSLYFMMVEIWSKSLLAVDLIEAGVLQFGEPDSDLSAEFLGFMATMPYDGAEPGEARSWVEQTLPTIKREGDIREATFGGIKFQLFGIPTARFLTIGEELPFP